VNCLKNNQTKISIKMRLHNTQKGLKWAFKPYMHKIQAKKKKNQNYYWGKKKNSVTTPKYTRQGHKKFYLSSFEPFYARL